MRYRFLGSALFFLLLSSALQVRAQSTSPLPAKIELVTWNIPLMVEGPDKGIFIELVKEIGRRSNKNIQVAVRTTGPALMSFSNNKFHGYFPAHTLSMEKDAIHTSAFYTKNDFIFFRKDKRLTTVKDLEGKKIGLTFRYFYDPEIMTNKKIRIEYADDDFINMKKLGEGLIDAFVVEERSGLRALQKSGFANIAFEKKSPLSAKSIYFAFENSTQGEALRDLFDRALNEMRKDGSLDRLLSSEK